MNATALVFAGLAPVLWILYAIAIRRGRLAARAGGDRAHRRAHAGDVAVVDRGAVGAGRYGLNILKFTETLQVVSRVVDARCETLRGLGYWFFYGIDRIGHWTDASVPYMQNLWLLAVSFALPVLALLRRRVRALAPPRVLRAAHRGRRRGGGGREPLRRPVAARRHVQVVRGVVELRARAAQHEPRGAAGRARARGAARRGGERARAGVGRQGAHGAGRPGAHAASWPVW